MDMMTGSTAKIALILGESRIDADIASGFRSYAQTQQLSWSLNRFSQFQVDHQMSIKDDRLETCYDGFVGFFNDIKNLQNRSINHDVPIVQLGHNELPHSTMAMVQRDDEAIGRMAAEHLIAQDYRHFACLSYDKETVAGRRIDAYRSRLKQAGFRCTCIKPSSGSPYDAEADLARRIKKGPLPLAIYFHQDRPALYFLDLCSRHKIRIPEEVAILGVDDVETCTSVSPPMSSVVIPWRHVGSVAAEYMHRMLSGAQVQPDRIVQPVFVAHRQSTRPVKPADALTERVRRFLERHYSKPLRISEIAKRFKMDRSVLSRRFTAIMGHSLSEHLQVIRITEAKNLLARTDLSINTIMLRVGCPCRRNFNDLFKTRTGMTPTAFRSKCR